jgi:energy-coupling factor transport system permease protein
VTAQLTSRSHLLAATKTHPGAWWIAGLSLALCSSLSSNVFVLFGISTLSMVTVWLCRDESPWSRSISFYLQLGGIVVLLRLLFRIVFNLADASTDVAITLPSLSIDLGFGNSIHLLGAVSTLSIHAALVDGFRLAAIILSIGMANSLANPRKLLRATPGALYEVATAISIAINLAPQLITSLKLVRRARGLRGHSKGIKALTGIVIPVLEDTIDKSMQLAASMSARGFGRKTNRNSTQLLLARIATALTLILLTVGVAMLLFSPAQQFVDLVVIIAGFVSAGVTLRLSSSRTTRTKYIVQRWRLGDAIVIASSTILLVAAFSGVFAK